MQINKQTLAVLKNFSTINTNLVVKVGKNISTVSASKDILATYSGELDFSKQISIFNLNELLGVVSAFNSPEIGLDDKFMIISEGTQKVKYVYADESNLSVPPEKKLVMPAPEVKFILTSECLSRIRRMSGVLSADVMSIIGNGKNIIARVMSSTDPTGNTFDVDLDKETTDTFNILFKVEKLKMLDGLDYEVEISSKKISRFICSNPDLVYWIAVETGSVF